MFKKTFSILLSILVIAYIMLPATASTGTVTFKDKVNAMELEPLRPSYWDKDFLEHIDKVVKDKTSNYDKMVAVYNDVVADKVLKKDNNCVGYAVALQCAFEVLGFRTYYMYGSTKAQGGGWTQHAWVGVDIGSSLYYFDADLPALYGVDSKKCFAVPYKNAPLYTSAYIQQVEIAPDSNAVMVLAFTNGIPNSVSKRKSYRSVPDSVYSLYYTEDSLYWQSLISLNGKPPTATITYDKVGNEVEISRDGTVTVIGKAS